jgi:ABC-type Fe3+/spermidine/putrescine transport system ATPase subunit
MFEIVSPPAGLLWPIKRSLSLRHLHDTIQVTTIFVTHDQEESLQVSDRVGVMGKNTIEQFASPQEVYQKAVNEFVFKFLGNYNVFYGRSGTGSFVRSHDIAIFHSGDGDRPDAKTGVVSHIGFGGPVVKIELKSDDKNRIDVELTAQAYRDLNLQRGEKSRSRPGAPIKMSRPDMQSERGKEQVASERFALRLRVRSHAGPAPALRDLLRSAWTKHPPTFSSRLPRPAVRAGHSGAQRSFQNSATRGSCTT